jgi:predicted transcriptional regulator
MELKDIPKGSFGKAHWLNSQTKTFQVMDFSNPKIRHSDMLALFRQFSGSSFSIAMLARRYGVSERQVQYDVSKLERKNYIEREKVWESNGRSMPSKFHYIGADRLSNPSVFFRPQTNLNKFYKLGEAA